MTKWSHDRLASDLAQHLCSPHRMIWLDMQLGPAGSPRPDVYAIDKSFAHTRAISYEIKVSVPDFRSDVTAGKWQSYLEFSSGVVFCVPAGLITREDIPAGTGLMVRGEQGWRSMRAPTLKVCDIDWVVCRKLLIDGIDRMVKPTPRAERTHYGAMAKIAKRWGAKTAEILSDLDAARRNLDHWKEQAEEHRKRIGDIDEKIRSSADAMCAMWLSDFARSLGMPGDSGRFDIARRFQMLRDDASGCPRWQRTNMQTAIHALEQELARVRDIASIIDGAATQEVTA